MPEGRAASSWLLLQGRTLRCEWRRNPRRTSAVVQGTCSASGGRSLPPLLRPPLLIASAPGWGSRSRRMPCEPLDAPDDLRKPALSQLAFGQLQDEVPGMSDEASAGPEQALLQA